jgi:hypothetical protein
MKFFLTAAVLGVLLVLELAHGRFGWLAGATAPADDVSSKPQKGLEGEIETLRAEIKRLQDVAPDQAHAMISVAYNFSNLWFAARAENWPLAEFYWGETRSHLRWAVRIIPVRKDAAKKDIDLRAILQAVENSPLKQLQEAIQSRNKYKFEGAYRFMIESCYACHKAADKPYLHPKIPDKPAESIINFDPKAVWPR